MPARQVVLLTPSESSAFTQLLSRQHSVLVSPLAATLMDLPASVASKRLTAELTSLAATLTKNRGRGPRLTLSCRSLHQECFTSLVQSNGSTLFLKTAGVSPNNSHSGNCWQDTTPKGHFFRLLLSTTYTLFQVPYPVTPFLATLTKTAGCVPTLPKMEHAGQLIAAKTIPVTAAPSDSPTLRLLNPSTLALSDHTSAALAFSSPMYSICPARDLCSRAPGNVVGAFGICSHESPVTNHQSRFTASMANDDSGANQPEAQRPGFLARTLLSTDHKVIGLNYLWLALFSVFLGLAMSLLMRVHIVWPGVRLPFLSGSSLERYAALTTFHGSLMVFLVLTAAPQAGFGNYFLPLQIGAREMAFPKLNRLSFWATSASLLGLTVAFLAAPETGITLWIASVALFFVASLCNGINFSVTTIDLRARGMTLPRLPLTVWAWFINAILSTLIFSILLAASVCLLSDRLLSTHFFPPLNFLAGQPAGFVADFLPVLWQRLFWFFAQAEVYIAMLPCFGLVTHLLSTFSRKPVWMERLVVLALCGVGVFGFCVWGQHMFASGMNPFSPLVFSLLASSLGLPATILLISWLGTLWNARLQLNTSMLFAIGFVSLFMAGGISGIFLASRDLAAAAVSDEFVTGHFHLVMGVAATFAILGALFFWFPKLFGRRLNEPLGKLHFWITFAGVYCVFMPMHWLGLIAHSRISSGSPLASVAAAGSSIRTFITVAILLTVFAQGLFLINFLWSLFRGEKAEECNFWRATTLEWRVPSPPPADDFGPSDPVVYRGAYEFSVPDVAEDFVPQHFAPEQGAKARESGE